MTIQAEGDYAKAKAQANRLGVCARCRRRSTELLEVPVDIERGSPPPRGLLSAR